MSLTLTGEQFGQFRDALADAFSSLQALAEFAKTSGFVQNLEAAVPVNAGTREIAWKLLDLMEQGGDLDRVLAAAVRARPRNPLLVEFARSVGFGVFVEVSVDSFDLREQEARWVDAFAATVEQRLLILLIQEAEDDVLDAMVNRLYRYLADEGVHQPERISLTATITNPHDGVRRIAAASEKLKKKHVLFHVHAMRAQSGALCAFVEGVRGEYPGELPHSLVLLINIGAGFKLPADCIELPQWRYEQPALNLWVKTIAGRSRWTRPITEAFRDYLHEGASTGTLYDRMRNAIEFLRSSPTEEQLRTWMST